MNKIKNMTTAIKNLLPSYIKEAVFSYPWVDIIILSYPNQKLFALQHRQEFANWLKSKNLSYFWLLKLNKLNIPQYVFLVNFPLSYKEVQEKWSSIVLRGKATSFSIDAKDDLQEEIFNYIDKIDDNLLLKLRSFNSKHLFNYSGKDFSSYVDKYKTLFDSTLKQAELNFEEENYIRNAKEARDKFKERDFYKYLTYFTDQRST